MKMYKPLNNILLRIPLFPISYIEKAFEDEVFFDKLIRSDIFKRAIYFASPDLYYEADKYLSSVMHLERTVKMKISLFKYLSRMSMRCTPFGLFASCSICKITDKCDIKVDKYQYPDCMVRLDMLYLNNLWQKLCKNDIFKKNEKYKRNDSIYKLGERIRYVAYFFNGRGREYVIKEVNETPLLKFVLSNSKKYVHYEAICSLITQNFEIENNVAEEYVLSLIDNMLLVGSAAPTIVGEDYMHFLSNKLNSIRPDIAVKLSSLEKKIAKLKESPDLSVCDEFKKALNDIGVKYNKKYILQIDSFRSLKSNKFPKSILTQIKGYLEFFKKISPPNSNYRLENFKNKFRQKYEEQEVCLMEALDPDIGIDYGHKHTNIDNSLLDSIILPKNKMAYSTLSITPFVRILINKLMHIKNNVLEFKDEDVCELPVIDKNLPVSVAAMFSVVKQKSDKVYELSDLRFVGSSGANLLGRFAYGDDNIFKIVTAITDAEKKMFRGKIVAEIVHITESRTGNILYRPHIRDYEITYLTNNGCDENSDIKTIPVSDILISLKRNHIVLRSRSYGKEIIPRLTTAHNFNNNPTPIYRFLCDMQMQNCQSSLFFSWMGLENVLSALPRVIYKDVILSPARWNIKCCEIESLKYNDLEYWREKNGIPPKVLIVSGDNKLYINFNQPFCLDILKQEAKRGNNIVLEECISSKLFVMDDENNSYMNEFIIPLVLTDE